MDKNLKVICFISGCCLIWIMVALFYPISYKVPSSENVAKLGGKLVSGAVEFSHNIGKCTFTGDCHQ